MYLLVAPLKTKNPHSSGVCSTVRWWWTTFSHVTSAASVQSFTTLLRRLRAATISRCVGRDIRAGDTLGLAGLSGTDPHPRPHQPTSRPPPTVTPQRGTPTGQTGATGGGGGGGIMYRGKELGRGPAPPRPPPYLASTITLCVWAVDDAKESEAGHTLHPTPPLVRWWGEFRSTSLRDDGGSFVAPSWGPCRPPERAHTPPLPPQHQPTPARAPFEPSNRRAKSSDQRVSRAHASDLPLIKWKLNCGPET